MSSFRFSTRTAGSTRRPTPPRTSSCRTSSTYTHGVGASSGPPKQAAHVATRHACCASHRSQLAPAATVGLEVPGALSNRSASTTNSLGRGGTGCRIASRPGHRTRRPRTIRWRRRNRQRPWSGDRKSFDAGPGERWIKQLLTELSQRDDRWTLTNRRSSGPMGEERRHRCPLLGG